MDACAGSIAGAGGRNSVSLRAEALSRHFDRAFTLFADCLLDPAFPEEELERERQPPPSGNRRPRGPADVARLRRASPARCSSSHPVPHAADRRAGDGGATRPPSSCVAHHRRFHDPSRMVLAIIGDVNRAEVLERARTLFGAAGEGAAAVARRCRARRRPRERRRVHRTLARAQAHVVLGFQGLTLFDPDRYALEVLSSVLSGMGGRLFTELRDKRSMAYTRDQHGGGGHRPRLLRRLHRHQPGQARGGRGRDGGRAAARSSTSPSPRPSWTGRGPTWSARTRSACSATRPARRCSRSTRRTAWGWTTSSTTTSASRR